MSGGSDQRPSSSSTTREIEHPEVVRDIHALSPPQPASIHGRREDSWEAGSRSSNLSLGSDVANFDSMSREFNALVVAGGTAAAAENLGRIGEEEEGGAIEETNPLAIVPDTNPAVSPRVSNNTRASTSTANSSGNNVLAASMEEVSVHRVKKEEVAWKIGAWETAEVAKINNRFKTEEVKINVWESEQEEKAAARLKKIERKLEEKKARAIEKMQNDIAKAHRKAEEKKAEVNAKKGTKTAKILELSNMYRALGRAPSRRSIF